MKSDQVISEQFFHKSRGDGQGKDKRQQNAKSRDSNKNRGNNTIQSVYNNKNASVSTGNQLRTGNPGGGAKYVRREGPPPLYPKGGKK